MTRTLVGLLLPFLLAIAVLKAQHQPAGISTNSNPYLGSVAQKEAIEGVYALTLRDALTRALRYNLGAELAGESRSEVRAQRIIELSRLLPHIAGKASASSQQINLAAFGLSVPGFPQIVGPFGLTDGRVAVSQQVLNFQSIRRAQASAQQVKAAELNYADARNTVAAVIGALYLQAGAGASRIEASQAQVNAAKALYDQAVDFKKSGVVPGIDVLRAQVEWQAQKQRLIAFQAEFEKQKLSLARAIGLPDGTRITLADAIPESKAALPTVDEALGQSYANRKDYLSQKARVTAAEISVRAARAQYLPSVQFNGDYGAIGPNPANSHGTFTAAVAVNIPIFEGNRVKGETQEAESQLRQLQAQEAELRGRIGFEVRSAQLDLASARDQVDVSRSAVDLARQQELQARDRFAAGVTNNLEVVQAQEALATANENFISSLYTFNVAKASLARAMGIAETRLIEFLQGDRP